MTSSESSTLSLLMHTLESSWMPDTTTVRFWTLLALLEASLSTFGVWCQQNLEEQAHDPAKVG